MLFRSDPSLVAEIRKYGRFNTNACLQCGSCTIACDLPEDVVTFPRRTMRYALLGLKEPLLHCLDPWLCTYCGDCTPACPRESEPAEAMMTLRRYLTAQYDWTGLAAKIYKSRAWEIGALLSVAALVLALVGFYHLYVADLDLGDFLTTPDRLDHMFGIIHIFTVVVIVMPFVLLFINATRMYRFVMGGNAKERIPVRLYLRELKALFVEAAMQLQFRECRAKWPWVVHFPLVPASVAMFVLLVFFLGWFQTDNLYPIYHPQRWLGYLITACLILGTGTILLDRFRRRELIHKFSEAGDWILPALLLLTAVSGILVHTFRYLGLELTTHYAYAIHLAIAVPMMVVEIPFGKWGHMFYHPLSFYLQRVKKQAAALQAAETQVQKEVLRDAA